MYYVNNDNNVMIDEIDICLELNIVLYKFSLMRQ